MTKEEFAELMGIKSVKLTEKVKNKLIDIDKELNLCYAFIKIEDFLKGYDYFFFRKENMFLTGSNEGNYFTISESEFFSLLETSNSRQTKPCDKPLNKRQYLYNLSKQIEANKVEFNNTADKKLSDIDKSLCLDGYAHVDEKGLYTIEKPLNFTQLEVLYNWAKSLEF